MPTPTPVPTGSWRRSADALLHVAAARAGVNRPALAAGLVAAALAGALLGAAWTRRGDAGAGGPASVPAAATPLSPASTPASRPRSPVGVAPRIDPVDRQALMQRYANELDEDMRGALLAELQRHPDAALRDFALALVASGDADGRLRGYELLAAFPLHDDPDARAAMLAGLRGERDPRVLARVAELMVPTMLPASEAGPIAEALQAVATHDDPDVRARGVVQAAQWAAPGEAEGLLASALLDDSPRVRQAAVAGVIATRAHSPRLKDALLWIAGDAAADADQRAAAVFALQWYRLDDAEYALYRQAEADTGHAH